MNTSQRHCLRPFISPPVITDLLMRTLCKKARFFLLAARGSVLRSIGDNQCIPSDGSPLAY